VSGMLSRGDEVELTLDAPVEDGRSVGRVNGLVVFVQGAVPGDTVRARVVKVKRQFAEARVEAVMHPSPLRTVPRCSAFGVCGGCRWQHLQYGAQLAFKRQQVIDALERIGGLRGVEVHPTLPSPREFFYRNKMEFSFGERWLTREELDAAAGREVRSRFALGLHIPKRFDRVLDLDACWLLSERSHQIVNTVRSYCMQRGLTVYSTETHDGYLRNLVLREGTNTGELMVNLVTTDERPALNAELSALLLREFPWITTIVNNITERTSLVAVGDREVVLHGPGSITDRIGTNHYRISANSFFQTNTLQAERLYDVVKRMAALRSDDVVFDLYSGIGTIALHLAAAVRSVVGVEVVAAAIADARNNALANGKTNCEFIPGDLKDRLTRDNAWLEGHPAPTVVVTDPPRSGMHENVVRHLLTLKPERLVYVSCNPATQARDLAILCAPGGYRVSEIQPVDMFPHTSHVENVASLVRQES
jgi:23S rRNA (uracil1939-C5)-methyltransferase